ncbi:hypothetical protein HYX14_06230 [Candidatus Woesearchaeota archaeon]|nr:hypothetical protein [Candidatus Woesearchaeota archaeon]
MKAAIRRGGGLDDVLCGMKPQQPETERHLEPVGEQPFSALLDRYKAFLDDKENDYSEQERYNTIAYLTDILNPEHINAFLQSTVIHGNHEKYKWRTGLFLSRLLQNSYNAGNNDFSLNTTSIEPFCSLGTLLKGTKRKPITLTINGDVGGQCGSMSTHGIYTINGDVGSSCGDYSINVTYTIIGNVGIDCGWMSKHGIYMITGDVGETCGSLSKDGTYTINGNVGDGCGLESTNGTYKTPHQHIAEKLKQNISKKNTIIYLTPEGREEVIT